MAVNFLSREENVPLIVCSRGSKQWADKTTVIITHHRLNVLHLCGMEGLQIIKMLTLYNRNISNWKEMAGTS